MQKKPKTTLHIFIVRWEVLDPVELTIWHKLSPDWSCMNLDESSIMWSFFSLLWEEDRSSLQNSTVHKSKIFRKFQNHIWGVHTECHLSGTCQLQDYVKLSILQNCLERSNCRACNILTAGPLHYIWLVKLIKRHCVNNCSSINSLEWVEWIWSGNSSYAAEHNHHFQSFATVDEILAYSWRGHQCHSKQKSHDCLFF